MTTDSRILLGVVLTAVLMAATLLVGPRIIIALLCDRDEDRRVLDAQTDFFCSEDHKTVYGAWGECGLTKECIDPKSGMTDGSVFVAQSGHLQAKALYSEGKESGGSTGYDSEGKPHTENGGYQMPVEPSS